MKVSNYTIFVTTLIILIVVLMNGSTLYVKINALLLFMSHICRSVAAPVSVVTAVNDPS